MSRYRLHLSCIENKKGFKMRLKKRKASMVGDNGINTL